MFAVYKDAVILPVKETLWLFGQHAWKWYQALIKSLNFWDEMLLDIMGHIKGDLSPSEL